MRANVVSQTGIPAGALVDMRRVERNHVATQVGDRYVRGPGAPCVRRKVLR